MGLHDTQSMRYKHQLFMNNIFVPKKSKITKLIFSPFLPANRSDEVRLCCCLFNWSVCSDLLIVCCNLCRNTPPWILFWQLLMIDSFLPFDSQPKPAHSHLCKSGWFSLWGVLNVWIRHWILNSGLRMWLYIVVWIDLWVWTLDKDWG